MIAQPRRAYLLLNAEPELDCADPAAAIAAMRMAPFVVALSPFRHKAAEYAHLMLPIAPFTETAGTFISTEGRVQSFHPAVRPLGETRPAWKVLRVLGGLLELPGFEHDTAEQVRAEGLGGRDLAAALANSTSVSAAAPARGAQGGAAPGLQRIADVPIHFADALARRSAPLQATHDAQASRCWMNSRVMHTLGIAAGQAVRVRQGEGRARLVAALDERLPDGCVRVAAAHEQVAGLGPMFGAVTVEKIAMERAA
jgi:NADH-quinone oxidoreductase subunit G